MNKITANKDGLLAGNCEVCGNPTETLYLDCSVWKCIVCVNPQLLEETLKSPEKIGQIEPSQMEAHL